MVGPSPNDPDGKVLRAVALWPQPVVMAGDVEPSLSVGEKQTLNRLKTLSKRGLLGRRTVGSSGNVFWLTDEGRRVLAAEEFDARERP
jgi:RIO-like serine/threonine protein kinase